MPKIKGRSKRPGNAVWLSCCKQEADCNKPAGQKVGLFEPVCAKEKENPRFMKNLILIEIYLSR